jgi:positive regulator of sigma E activity
MAEREAQVMAVTSGQVRLRTDAATCRGCRIGCGGRCNVFRSNEAGEITLPLPEHAHLGVGDHVRLAVDEVALRRAAFTGYGLALLGLLAGAGIGFGLAAISGLPRDPLTLIGLVAGTVWMLQRSKRHELQPHLEKLEDGPYPVQAPPQPLQSKPRP